MARPKTRTPEDLKRYQHEWYLANREKCIARATERKRRLAAEKRAEEAEFQAALDAFDLKICARCDGMRLRSEFYRSRSRPDGLHPYCKPCQDAVVREHHARRGTDGQERRRGRQEAARALVDEAKDRPCADCGGTWPARVMHLHHVEPTTKRGGVSTMVSRATRAAIEVEIAKCIVLCANCHAIRHMGEVE